MVMSSSIPIASPRLAGSRYATYSIYLPESSKSDSELIIEFISIPVIAEISPMVKWADIGDYENIRFYRQRGGGNVFIGQCKKNGIKVFLERFSRPMVRQMYEGYTVSELNKGYIPEAM